MPESATTTKAVEVDKLVTGYGAIPVIHEVSFDVGDEIFSILGANGAGKTTLLASMARLLPVMDGSISFHGTNVSNMRAPQSSALGVGYVPQEGAVFPDLNVEENLLVGGMIGKRSQAERLEEVFETFPDLRNKLNLRAGDLSGGESRMVACGRALMQDPKVLLLDEPTAGLSPLYVELFFETIAKIHEARGVAIVLTEQNATQALAISDRVMVLSVGQGSEPMAAADVTTDLLKEGYKL